jgi:hypothetical protein
MSKKTKQDRPYEPGDKGRLNAFLAKHKAKKPGKADYAGKDTKELIAWVKIKT